MMDSPFGRALKPGYASPSYGGLMGFPAGRRGLAIRSSNYVHIHEYTTHKVQIGWLTLALKGVSVTLAKQSPGAQSAKMRLSCMVNV